jgi:acetyl esterase
MILYYPAVNLTGSGSGSMGRFATGYGLDAAFFNKAIDCYIPDPAVRAAGTASPVHSTSRNLPPALIITAQFDILRDDAARYARKLKQVRYICLPGVTHAFLDSPGCSTEFQLTMQETAGFIRIGKRTGRGWAIPETTPE